MENFLREVLDVFFFNLGILFEKKTKWGYQLKIPKICVFSRKIALHNLCNPSSICPFSRSTLFLFFFIILLFHNCINRYSEDTSLERQSYINFHVLFILAAASCYSVFFSFLWVVFGWYTANVMISWLSTKNPWCHWLGDMVVVDSYSIFI